MKLSRISRVALYKNDLGGRIILKVNLPKTDFESELLFLYERLTETYHEYSRQVLEEQRESMFLTVDFEIIEGKTLKIKRLCTIKRGAKTLKTVVFCDEFYSDSLKLKR